MTNLDFSQHRPHLNGLFIVFTIKFFITKNL